MLTQHHAATSLTAAPLPAKAKAKSVAAAMADFITRQTAANGGVTRDDLMLDFTAAEIDANIEAAKMQARNAGKARR